MMLLAQETSTKEEQNPDLPAVEMARIEMERMF